MKLYYQFGTVLLVLLCMISCDKDPTLATVNGKSITESQFNAYLKFKRLPSDDENRRKALLDQYLEREALASMIEKSDVLDSALTQAELNEFRKEMLISRYFEKFLKSEVTEDAVKNYYAGNASNYEERKVQVSHLLFRLQRGMSEAERKAKLTTAQEAYSKIKSGQDFEKIAKEYSEDQVSAKKGGSLGWLKEGAIDPLFSKTVFEMEKDAISEPFETPFGFHIVRLDDGPTVVKRPFEAVQGDIRYQLRNKSKNAELERLMSASSIEK